MPPHARGAAPSHLRWKPNQYEHSACNGLETAGGVCPAVLLPCSLRLTPWDAEQAEQQDCLVQPLYDFGFNAAISLAPPGMLRALRQSYPKLRYVAVDRYEPNNKLVRCRNPHVQNVGAASHKFSASEVLLLDRNLRVLDREHITGGECVNGRWRVSDARLVVANRTLWMSYFNAWGSTPAEGGAPCKGYWMAKLHVNVGANARQREGASPLSSLAAGWAARPGRLPIHATLHPTQNSGGVGIDGKVRVDYARRRHYGGLNAERNGGVMLSPGGDRIAFELADVAPITKVHSLEGKELFSPVPASFGKAVHHNSINPIWVPELGAYLGVTHRHYGLGTDHHTGRLDPTAPFQYGYSYRHVLFTIRPPHMRLVRHSRELCFPSTDGAAGNASAEATELCDGIQFIMGAFRQQPDSRTISFTFGVQDCETAILTLSIERINKLLEFG